MAIHRVESLLQSCKRPVLKSISLNEPFINLGENLMPYPELMIRPMREELTRLGFEELKTSAAVDDAVKNTDGTLMLVVNSVCGCAAGKARPGIALALQHNARPDRIATVFAGADIEATERAREYFEGYQPSSPSIALLKNGEVVYMMERAQIEVSHPYQIAQELTEAFNEHCTTTSIATN
jgi:putative YphP/YqiW family bacilliredoxin